MGRLMALVYDRVMARAEDRGLRAWRRDLLADLSGDVLEVGAGTGLSLPHYGPGVTRLVLSEPDPHMRVRLEERLAGGTDDAPDAEVLAAGLEDLPLADGSVDAVVCGLVLCSVGDPVRCLAEVRRVLRPGGVLVFIEHVRSDAPLLALTQRIVEPFWRLLAGGCRTTRATERLIAQAGFDLPDVRRDPLPAAPPWVRPCIRGRAQRAA